MMDNFIFFLKSRLSKPLPGHKAHLKMAPKPISEGPERPMVPDGEALPSSVLVLLFPNEKKRLELLLTLRSEDIDHGGQISFPGGRAEAHETIPETALREAREEVGLRSDPVEIIGELSELYIPHSNSRVTPVVGYLKERPALIANPDEVDEIFSVELHSLASKKNLIEEQWKLREYQYQVPYWDVHRVPLWGATAMMLNELLDLYREFQRSHQTSP